MSITTCSECGKSVSDKAKACPHCGASKPASWLWLKLVLGVPVLLFALMVIVGSCMPNSELMDSKAKDRTAIKLCWEEQSRKSIDPGTARFIASACEMMERNFQGKYNAKP